MKLGFLSVLVIFFPFEIQVKWVLYLRFED